MKIKEMLWVAGLVLIGLFTLLQYELIAYHDLVELEANWLYEYQEYTPVNVQRLEKLSVEAQICRVFGKDCKIALAVSQAENGTRACNRESKFNKNGTRDIGVFQINTIHSTKGYNLYDCTDNIKLAYQIYKASGWYPWTVYQNKSYKKFLN